MLFPSAFTSCVFHLFLSTSDLFCLFHVLAFFLFSSVSLSHIFKSGFEYKRISLVFVFLSQPYFTQHNGLYFHLFPPKYHGFTFLYSWWSSILYVSHILSISGYDDGSIGWSHCLTVVNKAAIDFVVQESLWHVDWKFFYPRMESLGHMEFLFSFFWGISKLSSIVEVAVYLPTRDA